jgi:hypothetical protein
MKGELFDSDAKRIKDRYDPNFDYLPEHPVVSRTDMQLLEMIEKLGRMVQDLQAQIHDIGG